MASRPASSDQPNLAALGQVLDKFFDPDWYRSRYPDVETCGVEPITHFLNWGAAEGRDPNRWFDSRRYLQRYPDVTATGMPPLLHYMVAGAAELRNPHPRFDAAWYAEQHPEAAANPLLHHLLFGEARGWATEPTIDVADFLPASSRPLSCPADVQVDVVIPVYRGIEETRRCLDSVLADPERPQGNIIVVDDRSPEPALSAWLDTLAADRRITLLRNPRNLGFVASVNRGMEAAARHDVALLNSDTEVPAGWLRRLAAQAYAGPRIASVSPFSNNATICSYPSPEGGPLPLGQDTAAIDAVCRKVNAGRSIAVPTTVGFCMYIRRAALDAVGSFDAKAFGRGYGEENDFCLRAAQQGWSHRLACDTFVFHAGAVSFGSSRDALANAAMATLLHRYPDYLRQVDRHVRAGAVAPSRFALTAGLYRAMKLPVILLVSHQLGGGVQRHLDALVTRLAGRANVLLLQDTTRGAAVSAPGLHDEPFLTLPGDRLDDLLTLLRSAGVSRVHVHHVMGLDLDLRELIHRLEVPHDVTLHDYFAICPQVNLLPFPASHYCGEPDQAVCNACIADRPSHGAKDILSWRRRFTWLFLEADRVICPSVDARSRLERYGLAEHAITVLHEPVPAGPWLLKPMPLKGKKLRVALLGVLANQKGAQTVIAVAETADPASLDLHLIGHPEDDLPEGALDRITVTGRYDEAELPTLLARVKPHVVWFPAQWPETYSYTLSAALAAGLPVIAPRIGSFPERLAGRPLTWLLHPRAAPQDILRCFVEVRVALAAPIEPAAAPRSPVLDYYATEYLRPAAPARVASATARAVPGKVVDLRRAGRTSVVVVPETLDNGEFSPCAYIRLLQPLDHAAGRQSLDIVLADSDTALDYRPDYFVTQRYAVPDLAAADRLAAHCRRVGAALVYDLDDDLLNIPRDHADAAMLRPKAKIVQRLLRDADAVHVSTDELARVVAKLRPDALVVPNALDERLWNCRPDAVPPGRRGWGGPVRLLYMGTATHGADFAMIEPALARLSEMFGERVAIDIVGVSMRSDLPSWAMRPEVPPGVTATYPGFVNWITQQPGWDIGLAPLLDNAFTRCKSAIKTLDYAALGLSVIASDVPAYRGSLADGSGGILVPNRPETWFAALSRLVRDGELRRGLAQGGWQHFTRQGILARCPPWPLPRGAVGEIAEPTAAAAAAN